MVVGKAIYEGMLLKCSFAKFFLNKFVVKSNTLDDLKTYDKDLYNNLMFLKYFEGDAKDLGLSFSISEDFLGK
jgi:ubiquitin-protein ligase E3 C